MPRRVVWYLPGSPAASLLTRLPDDLEARPLPAHPLPLPAADESAVVVLDIGAGDSPAAAEVATRRSGLPIVVLVDAAASGAPPAAYAYVAKPVAPLILAKTLRNACEHFRVGREVEETRKQLEELNTIGVRLSAERDTDVLLDLVLTKAREITHSDAGSIYLVEESEQGRRQLRFKLAQNDSVTVPFAEFTLPIDEQSVVGHVVLTGEILQLDDAYVLPEGSPFHINRDFDVKAGYRTKSMLVVPMKTPAGEIIGALQLINCKRDMGLLFSSAEAAEHEALPYPARFRDLAASLGSQAAVALQNSRLYASIRTLFEGFVQASVTAIESRDPTTSGHSFRVADLTVALAVAADRADHAPFRDLRFSPDELKELRYASLLHDFGKVGVREEVLVKAKKLHAAQLNQIRQRAEILKRGLELKFARRKLDHLLEEGRERYLGEAPALDAELAALLAELDQQVKAVAAANEPTVMAEEVASGIRQLAVKTFVDHLGERHTLITPDEARILSIARGSLTEEEYRQIQSHVVHTYQFLRQIPWTRELRRIPEIARSHHEKLNGSGYPEGRRDTDIPVQARMMTISDIFDALTASDRPYKAAVSVERALDILDHERRAGAIDSALLDLFVTVEPWKRRPA